MEEGTITYRVLAMHVVVTSIETDWRFSRKIDETFGDLEEFKRNIDAAVNTFGSGFVWLIIKDGNLEITSTPNQDNPLMETSSRQGLPILALDVWEHAYYISYRNRRPDYINAWWNVVDWKVIEENYLSVVA